MKNAGKEWRKRRELADISQQRLAELVGCSLSMIRFIETGRRSPSVELAEKMDGALAPLERTVRAGDKRAGKDRR